MDKDEDSAQYLASSPKGYITMGKSDTIRESNQSRVYVRRITRSTKRAPGVLRIWAEWLFIFRELGSTGNYFQGLGEQAHIFGDLENPAKN